MRRKNNREYLSAGVLRDLTPQESQEPPEPAPVGMPSVSGWVNYASWLSDDLLLIVGWFPTADEASPTMSLLSDTRSMPLETRCMSFRRPDLPGDEPHLGKVVTASFDPRENSRGPLGTALVHTGATTLALGPMDLAQALIDLQTLLRGSLAWWDREMTIRVMEFLSATLTEHQTVNDLRLSKSLFIAREVLRGRLPLSAIVKDQAQGLHVDALLAVDQKSFYLKGWMRDVEAEITHLIAVSPEGTETEIFEGTFRYPRPDVEQFYGTNPSLQLTQETGFISYFETEAPSRLPAGWVIQMRDAAGTAVEVHAPHVVRDETTVRDMILRDLIYERLPGEDLTAEHVFPAIDRIQERLKAKVEVRNVAHYGEPNQSPEVSIIIPLYRRTDLLEQQLAQFVHDPEVCEAELIYVLDSPELASNLAITASPWWQTGYSLTTRR